MARKISASRSASMRFSPLPATLTRASSRSSGSPSTVRSTTRVHRHHALELVLDLLEHHRRAFGDDREAREMLLVLGLGDRQALDVVAAAREQAGDARRARPARCRPGSTACARRGSPSSPRGSRRSRWLSGTWAELCCLARYSFVMVGLVPTTHPSAGAEFAARWVLGSRRRRAPHCGPRMTRTFMISAGGTPRPPSSLPRSGRPTTVSASASVRHLTKAGCASTAFM